MKRKKQPGGVRTWIHKLLSRGSGTAWLRILFYCGGAAICILAILPVGSMQVRAEGYWPTGPEVQAEAAVVMEASTGTVLYEKNPHEQLYPASITKIMTTLLAIENCKLDEQVTFSYDSVHKIERDSTHISRDVGEIMTMEQCLYGVMLGSANDCAYAVAEHAGNGYENFVAMMNERAAGLGCTDTHFNNPHGLPDPQHYTSAYDMALISREALDNDIFRSITGTAKYTIPVTNKHPNDETYVINHHQMLTNYKGVTKFLYKYCIGGKTGYTDAAGNTLVTYAEKDGMTLICVVLREPSESQYKDTRALFDYCYDNFKLWNVVDNETEFQTDGHDKEGVLGAEESLVVLEPTGQIVLPKTAAFTDASCSVHKVSGDGRTDGTVAVLEYTYADRVVGGADIRVTDTQVEAYPFQATETSGKNSPFIQIEMKYILLGVVILAALAGLALLIVFLSRDFYILRNRSRRRRGQKRRFKVIKRGRHSRWKTRW